MYDKYLDEFMPSEEMREYLKTPRDSVANIADVIYYSPKPAKEKLEALLQLQPEIQNCGDKWLIDDCNSFIAVLEKAKELLHVEGVFTIHSAYYDEETTDSDSSFDTLVGTFQEALDYIKQENEWNKEDEFLCWYEATKWIKDKDCKYKEACTYIIADDQLLFVDLDNHMFSDEKYRILGSYGVHDINLPVPFKAGDILEFDGYPYTPSNRILMFDIGDNRDCCCLQAMYKNNEGKWDIGALKHMMSTGFEAFPQISPLYTLKTYKGELSADEKFMKEVGDFVTKHPNKSEDLWMEITCKDGRTEDEIRKLMAESLVTSE